MKAIPLSFLPTEQVGQWIFVVKCGNPACSYQFQASLKEKGQNLLCDTLACPGKCKHQLAVDADLFREIARRDALRMWPPAMNSF